MILGRRRVVSFNGRVGVGGVRRDSADDYASAAHARVDARAAQCRPKEKRACADDARRACGDACAPSLRACARVRGVR